MVDSAVRDRIDVNAETLKRLADDEDLKDAILMVYANKQDMPNAMTCPELIDKLGLANMSNRKWYIQSTCATTGHGLYEGLDWVTKNISKAR